MPELYALLYVLLILLSILFLWKRRKERDENTSLDTTLCQSPSCVRCNSNAEVLNRARVRCREYGIGGRVYEAVSNQPTELVLEIADLRCQAYWSPDDLSENYKAALSVLEAAWRDLKTDFDSIPQSDPNWRWNTVQSGNRDWGLYPLMNQGRRLPLSHCHSTHAVLDSLAPVLMEGCVFGNAAFSLIPAGARIEEHRGSTNARLRCHLGLEVPDPELTDCRITVGGEKREWKQGKAFVFDDSLLHSVEFQPKKNSSHLTKLKQRRVILMLDFWHPNLSCEEVDNLRCAFGTT